ncbi:MAG: Hsp20/alpha crystallin family protein [Deltaproteobacteria bacterium]|nr:Hsp20/alpha crystallin family protein [Deltaproteobacteria bacterium]
MAPTKWDPFKDILTLQERMSRIFDETLLKYKGSPGISGNAWYPPVDIYESEDHIVLKAELPGVDVDNVMIEIHDNTLVLKGERKQGRNLGEENYQRMERFYGAFHREFSLPYTVDNEGVKAGYKDGVLKITVPKTREEKKQGKIKVHVQ